MTRECGGRMGQMGMSPLLHIIEHCKRILNGHSSYLFVPWYEWTCHCDQIDPAFYFVRTSWLDLRLCSIS
jgi:hypothetical protein